MSGPTHTTNGALSLKGELPPAEVLRKGELPPAEVLKKGELPPAEVLRLRCNPPDASSSVLPQERNGIEPGLQFFDYDRPREDFAVPTVTIPEATFRHSFWRNDRLAVWTALKALGASRNRLDRFANCGSMCHVEYNHDQDRFRLTANYCHDRWCLPCAKARSRFISANLVAQLNSTRDVRCITLTLKHRPVALSVQIDRLYASFKTLKAHPTWKAHVQGGAAFLEFVIAQDGSDWHPHLHIIAQGTYFDHADLSRLWYEITGDSSICFIERPKDLEAVGFYAAKYASKSADRSLFRDPQKLAECIQATKGRHLCQCFGSWRGIQLTPKSTDHSGWSTLYSLGKLLALAQAGNPQASRILSILRRQEPDNHPPAEVRPDG